MYEFIQMRTPRLEAFTPSRFTGGRNEFPVLFRVEAGAALERRQRQTNGIDGLELFAVAVAVAPLGEELRGKRATFSLKNSASAGALSKVYPKGPVVLALMESFQGGPRTAARVLPGGTGSACGEPGRCAQ